MRITQKENIMSTYNTKTLQFGSCTIRVHRPILTDQERKEREKQIQNDLTNIMAQIYRRKERTA